MKKIISYELGRRIRNIRMSKGISMTSLAHESDMEYIQLSRIERGQINTTVFQLYKITKSLGISLIDLFSNIEENLEIDYNKVNSYNNSSEST